VVESTYSDEPAPCGTTTSTTLPGNTFYDITSVNVWHGLKALHVKVNVRDLPRSRAFDGLAGVATDGRDFILDVSRFKDGGATETFFAIQPEKIDPPTSAVDRSSAIPAGSAAESAGPCEPRRTTSTSRSRAAASATRSGSA
jgi:hypothetical protein